MRIRTLTTVKLSLTSQVLCQVLGRDKLDGSLAVAHGRLVHAGNSCSDTLIHHSLTAVVPFLCLSKAGSRQHLHRQISLKCAI